MSTVEPAPEACGESYDHDLHLIAEADGIRAYECRECGAEVIEEDEPEGSTDAT